MNSLILATTTFENTDDAEKIANQLLDHKLVACAQISQPVTSIYNWKGKRTKSIEYLLTLKTTMRLVGEVEKFIQEKHPYDLPEITCQQIDVASPQYTAWVVESVKR